MKPNVPASSALPAALAAASISLSLLLLPAGGASIRSSGLAPALNLVARDVVAVVKSPVHAVTEAQPNPASAAATPAAVGVAATSQRTQPAVSSSGRQSHHAPAHPARVSQRHPTPPAPVTKTAVPAPKASVPKTVSPIVGHGHGKAVGQVRKLAAPTTAASRALHGVKAHGNPVKEHGRPADVPHGPPAVPPGHDKVVQTDAVDAHGNAVGRGGGR